MSKQTEVKTFFEQPEIYLHFDYNLRIRKETVTGYLEGKSFDQVLDMPCGSGDISLPLATQFKHLTLIDFASNMVDIAREKSKEMPTNELTFINDDFFNADLPDNHYDLLICLGILAHVNDPAEFIRFASAKLKPGGLLVIQNTDSSHWYSGLIRMYLGVRKLAGKDKYRLNKVPHQLVVQTLKEEGLTLEKDFRYNQSFLGFSRLFSNDKKYRLTRRFFGDHHQNKHAGWGSDHTYLFSKP